MRWKSLAVAGALAPAVMGCNIYYNAARNLLNEPHVVGSQVAITHELRKAAKTTWSQVREQYPRRAFTAEFRDGFLDGYVDYLDQGGNGSTTAVPPPKYTRQKKYYTEEGQCLMKHYLLGFQYGQEVAIATGRRPLLTVPVLLPETPKGPPAFNIQPHGSSAPPTMTPPAEPPGSGTALPPDRQPTLPAPLPLPGNGSTALPAPDAVLPVPASPIHFETQVPQVPAVPAIKLPPPPPEVPTLPDHVPTPSVLDELPAVLPIHSTPPPVLPIHATPPPVPPNHPEAPPGK